MSNRYAVVLAAGKGTRMKSNLYKVLHPVLGKPMVQHVVDQLKALQLSSITTVVGFGAEKVQDQLGTDSEFVIQEEQLGTGHAVQQAEKFLGDKKGTTIVVCGDTPLLTKDTLQAVLDHHEQEEAAVTILTAHADNPAGYGRIVRNDDNQVSKIVEQKDATDAEQAIQEINTGTYCFDNELLFDALKQVSNDNSQGEYYLPDVIEIAQKANKKVAAYQTADFAETIGVNDRVALSQAEKLMKLRINEQHMRNGVTIIDPDNTYIGSDVTIGTDVVIEPGCVLKGSTTIHNEAVVGPNSELNDCEIGEQTIVRHSVVNSSSIGQRVQIGPFAHVRPAASIGDDAKIGNFVEIKKAKIESNSKVSHLSYIGDAEVGRNVNIGCGTITVNYDGKNKFKTIIEDDAFIGCNANLIAPVTIGKGSLVAAGSTIHEDVPGDALSIGRAKQVNKEDYAKKYK
ncbi:bifunctional UDP-N-acetylglucosamine diphosphorylase/glucosamine-1-phosphate N-acetyltransferase GlmU [Gracilibacillus caseinilyticus]|uniref:Bifunctional protein GlmU n=1 Tax=Gracilibacillus caseinilyticus TaxID=2932256 RepID=A0ABY4EYP6_9BACI|nr:bifunctional UDP-N-acetylglucosamine diphosphorylase/glucosamine-1-phosphate N-acetyltransferase GlmU [Gracilibacillus caseinilyticus]UOQ49525.1 bifunctional UDP-N-acetylglucosamine diphosphorylase/glucosamine-1-phosphate N-acetyltransferase GlmU [Gracilibacillus caseinilyticus]